MLTLLITFVVALRAWHEPKWAEPAGRPLPRLTAILDHPALRWTARLLVLAVVAVVNVPETPVVWDQVSDVAAWLETGAWRTGLAAPDREVPDRGVPARDLPARDFAAEVLDKALRRIRKRGRHLDRQEAEERHRVRIEAKKLRYGAEFFASLYTEKKLRKRHKAFVSALSDLQDHLGSLNDQATAHTVLASLVAVPDPQEIPGETAFAAGLAAGDNEADGRKLLRAAAEAHGDLVAVKPFWR